MIGIVSPIYDYGTLANSISIFLEIVGFILILITVKPIPRTHDSSFSTGLEHIGNVVTNTHAKLYYVGISFVIAGLAGQLLAQGIRGGW
jgi:uncharacterized membrane protein